MQIQHAKAEMIIELNTQEALSKISEMRVDLELADQPVIEQPVREQYARAESSNDQSVRAESSRDNYPKVHNNYTNNPRPSLYATPAVAHNSPVSKTYQEGTGSNGSPRKAMVKVNSVQAHISATTS